MYLRPNDVTLLYPILGVKKMSKINSKMTISEVLKEKPEASEVLHEFGMHCLGCAIAAGESIEEAAEAHGIKLEDLLAALNK